MNVLVELLDKALITKQSHIIHVDTSFKPIDFQNYINTLNDTDLQYTFYINGEVLRHSLDDHIIKHNLDLESKIIIEFLSEKDKFESEIETDKQISFIRNINDYLVIGFYEDQLKNEKLENYNQNSENSEYFYGLRDYGYDQSGMYCINIKYELIDINNCKKIIDDCVCLRLFNYLFFTIKDGSCYKLNGDNLDLIGKYTESTIVDICIYNNCVYFVFQDGYIIIYDKEVSTIRKEFNITAVHCTDTSMLFGTAANKIYIGENTEECNVDIRYITYMVVYKNILVISGQYKVQMISLEDSYKVINQFKFESEISGLVILKDKLYISSGTKIFKKNL